VLSEIPFIPNSVSHKELSSLFPKAIKELSVTPQSQGICPKEIPFRDILGEWFDTSTKLLEKLNCNNSIVVDNLSPQQAMALGALKVHLSIALQAKNKVEEE